MENRVHKGPDPAPPKGLAIGVGVHPRVWPSKRRAGRRQMQLFGSGTLYNMGNVLALGGGICLALYDVWGQASLFAALQAHLAGSTEAVWLSASMLLFIASGEVYRRAGRPNAPATLIYWGDFTAGIGAIGLTVALMMLGASGAALLAGVMLTVGKLGTALVPLLPLRDGAQMDRMLRLAVVASRAPSLFALIVPLVPAVLGWAGHDIAPLSVIMILCFLLWLWADLRLMSENRRQAAA